MDTDFAAFATAVGSALWLGILTSISPCPLATNVAALSYIGKRVDRPVKVLPAGLLYTVGRIISYFAVAFISVRSIASTPEVSMFLQRNMNQFVGPVLIIVGIFLLDVVPWPWVGTNSLAASLKDKVDRLGLPGALLLGLIFALSFCPVSAALFFGSLLPLAVKYQSAVLIPMTYGLGTALPVVLFSVLIAFAAHRVSRAFNVLTAVAKWMQRITAVVFIVAGGYYCAAYLLGIV
ncbi:MAG: sulfite exporter TauE/SafE family protein [Deltaproteobacteria bacterium]|nr:sulfite exporter TauE/SafE family protein [Deltaproteobacteria bacterium]